MSELISVVMAEYNTDYDSLKKSIDSILKQTYEKIEIIIVDDNTNVKNKGYLDTLSEQYKNINLISNEKNLGLAASLNKAINHSNGEYIFRMDTDDIALPHRFEHQVKILSKGYDITTGRVIVVNSNDEEIGRTRDFPFYRTIKSLLLYYFFSNGVVHPLIACKRKVFDEFKYDENIKYAQDFELWLRISHKYKIFFDKEILLKYRRQEKVNVEKQLIQYRNHTSTSLNYIGRNPIKKIGYIYSVWSYKKNIRRRLNIDKKTVEDLIDSKK